MTTFLGHTTTKGNASLDAIIDWRDHAAADEAQLAAGTLAKVVFGGVARTVGLARLAGWIARQFGFHLIVDPLYGASTTKTAAENQTAINAAIAGAVAAGGVAVITPGNFAINTLSMAGAGSLKGLDRDRSIITQSAAANGINCTATGSAYVLLENFTLAGPLGLGFDNTCVGFNWAGGGEGSLFEARRVKVTGTFEMCFQRSGKGDTIVDDCYLRSTDIGCGVFESTNTADSARCFVRGGDWGTPDGDLSSGGSVGLYIHPHIPFLVSGVFFHDLGRYAVYQNGTPSALRKPGTISRCTMVRAGIVQSKSHGVTNVIGCTQKGISGKGSLVDGIVNFVGCTFEDVEYVSEPYNLTKSRVSYAGCTFINSGVYAGGPAGSVYTFDDACRWLITGTAPASQGRCVFNPHAGTILRIAGEIEDESTVFATYAALYFTGASLDARISVRMRGVRASVAGFAPVYIGADPTRIEFNDAEFDIGAAGNTIAIRMVTGVLANKIHGRNNRFIGQTVLHASSIQQQLQRPEALSPTTIASSAGIGVNTPETLSYNTHLVSGSAAIANLTAPYPCSGLLRLIVAPGGTWSTANTGNILPKSTAARTAGEVVSLYWEPTTAKWVEV